MTGGFHPHGVGHSHAHHGGHYAGVHAQSAYGNPVHSHLTYVRPLPIRAPVLPPAFNHQHTGQHQHGRTSTFSMTDPAFMTAEEEHAYMQKLSSEYEPEATVSPMISAAPPTEYGKLTQPGSACRRAPEQRCHHHPVCQRRSRLQDEDCRAARQVCLLPHLSRRRPLWMARYVHCVFC
jgi:hypothetical protein